MILIFSVNTNHESVAYRSFSPSEFEARGARKVTTGINYIFMTSPRLHNALKSSPVYFVLCLSRLKLALLLTFKGDTPGCGEPSLGSWYQGMLVTLHVEARIKRSGG